MTIYVRDRILALRLDHPVRVAIDGRTASGKTTYANSLASLLEAAGRKIIRASIDGFHRPAADRHRRGRLSADGYYEDARDLHSVRSMLLDPLGPGGHRNFAVDAFDLEQDVPIDPVWRRADEDAILIVDGTFLQRLELRDAWDFIIFLDVSADQARRRGIARDAKALGGEDKAEELYLRRYGPAFDRYVAECDPIRSADVVISSRNKSTTAAPSARAK